MLKSERFEHRCALIHFFMRCYPLELILGNLEKVQDIPCEWTIGKAGNGQKIGDGKYTHLEKIIKKAGMCPTQYFRPRGY